MKPKQMALNANFFTSLLCNLFLNQSLYNTDAIIKSI